MLFKTPFQKQLPETQLALESAIDAGKIIMEIYKEKNFSTYKINNEPLTLADIKSDNLIQEQISSLGYPILSEERKDDLKRLQNKNVWIVDPLDGTADFVNKTGEFTVMIALVSNHVPILGIIYWPTQNILYVAQKDEGAFQLLNNHWYNISVSKISELNRCRGVGSKHHLSEREKLFLKCISLKQFISRGSSLKAVDVASGNAEIYFTTTNKIKQWDTCASYCIIKEAGGNITDMFGNDLLYNTKEVNHENGVLITNGLVHTQLVEKYKHFCKIDN